MKPSPLCALGLAALLAAPLPAARTKAAAPAPAAAAAGEARERLLQGNERFARGRAQHPGQDAARRKAAAARPQPWAAVLACSDSRVAPELAFDQGLGDLYVVRNLGNVAEGGAELSSLERSLRAPGLNLLLVLGHLGCDAIGMEVSRREAGHGAEEIAALETLRAPVAEAADRVGQLKGGALAAAAVESNVYYQMKQLLKKSALIRERVASGDLKLEGGIFNSDGGRVRWLGPHPSQAAILRGEKI